MGDCLQALGPVAGSAAQLGHPLDVLDLSVPSYVCRVERLRGGRGCSLRLDLLPELKALLLDVGVVVSLLGPGGDPRMIGVQLGPLHGLGVLQPASEVVGVAGVEYRNA